MAATTYDIEEMNKRLSKYMDSNRYYHTQGVRFISTALAMAHGADIRKAEVAGLLHDCAKCVPDAKKIKISKKGYTLKKGKTVKLKPTLVRKNKKKTRLPNYHAPKFRYATSNKNVTTVDKNGKVKAVGKGTCDVYAYAVNGMTQKVKFTVN